MADTNTGFRRFEHGGILTITVGAAVHVIKNIRAGTLKVKLPWYGTITRSDRGVLQIERKGDEEYGEVEFGLYPGDDTFNVFADSLRAAGTSGVSVTASIKVQIPSHRGSATGHQCVLDNCTLSEPEGYNAGGTNEDDGADFKFRVRTCTNGWETY